MASSIALSVLTFLKFGFGFCFHHGIMLCGRVVGADVCGGKRGR